MTTYSLGFDIWAKDRASKTFDTLGGSVDKADAKFGKLKAGIVAGAAAAGTALAAFAVGGIDDAADLEMAYQRIDLMFGESAGTIKDWASTAATNLGMSENAALDAAGGFGNMFAQLGFAKDEAANMSTGVVQLVADLAALNGLPTEQVLEGMQAAFRGEYDALQRVIPNINAARVETEALAMTGKKAASELTAQEKAAATLAIVTKDGATASGYFADNQDKMAVRSKQAQAGMADLQAEVGAKLVPAMTGLLGVANQVLGWMERSPGQAKAVAVAVGVLAAGLMALSVAQKVVTAAQWLQNAAFLANPIGLVIVAIGLLVGAFVLCWTKSETFRRIVTGAFEAIANVGIWLYNNALAPAMRGIITSFSAVMRTFGDMLAQLGKVPGFGWATDAANKMYGAANAADSLAAKIRDIPPYKRVTVETVYRTIGTSGSITGTGIRTAAVGGHLAQGELTLVGEKGPELWLPDTAGTVVPADLTRAMLDRGGPTPLLATTAGGSDTATAVRQAVADLGDMLHGDIDRLAVRIADLLGARWDRSQQRFVRALADEARRGRS